ncbi:MAG: IS200/IS605 family transposase [Bacteroidota bacterium]
MPFVKIWLHLVWSTKNREPYLSKDIREKVIAHIKDNAKDKKIFLDCINGNVDHLHCLISLGLDQNISKILMLLKGESSHWINENKLCKTKFEWQDEYFAVSVSESQVEAIRKYVQNQEEHHRKKTFSEEYEEFIRNYNFQKFG